MFSKDGILNHFLMFGCMYFACSTVMPFFMGTKILTYTVGTMAGLLVGLFWNDFWQLIEKFISWTEERNGEK
jgi:hypothetical protein